MKTDELSLNPSRITFVLGSLAFLLVFANLGIQLSKYLLGHGYIKGLGPLLNLNKEQNIPTFFSVLLLVFSSLLLMFISILNKKRKAPDLSKWVFLAFGFLYMAYDEAFRIHELLNLPFKRLLGDSLPRVFNFAWVIPGIALTLVLALFFLNFVLRLPVKTKSRFLLAAILYVGGSIGLELIGGAYASIHGLENLTYNMIATVEESLELSGLILFIYALLAYITDDLGVRYRLNAAGERL